MSGTPLRLLIVDDHPLMRQGIRQSLESASGMAVVGEAGDGRTALALIADCKPDVVVLDISMPGMDGFEVAREMQRRSVAAAIVFLTAQTDESLLDAALDLGAKAYVLKESTASDIVDAVRAAAGGQYYISPALTGRLVRARLEKAPGGKGRLGDLTPAEMRIIRLIAQYKTTREIAEELFISPLTVETHRRNICEKLGVRGSNALIKFVLANKNELQ